MAIKTNALRVLFFAITLILFWDLATQIAGIQLQGQLVWIHRISAFTTLCFLTVTARVLARGFGWKIIDNDPVVRAVFWIGWLGCVAGAAYRLI